MTLENLKRLYKHYMGTVKADGQPKPQQLVEADRLADKAKTGYNVDITVVEKPKVEEKPKKEKKNG